MIHQFDLQIDPITGVGQLLLNKQPLSAQSQLRVCATDNFYNWYRSLPGLLYAEVNDCYCFHVQCPTIQYQLLRAVFESVAECSKMTHQPLDLHYTMDTRVAWLQEAAQKLQQPLPVLPQFSIQTTGNEESLRQSIKLPPLYQKLSTVDPSPVNIWITSAAHLTNVPLHSMAADDLILCDTPENKIQVSTYPVYRLPKDQFSGAIVQWIDMMILAPYIAYCQELLLKVMKKPDFRTEAQVRMLTRDEPIVAIHFPDRLECGTSETLTIDEFPESALSLRLSDPTVLCMQNDRLLAQKAGTVQIAILSEQGYTLQTHNVTTHVVHRVTSITLNAPNNGNVLPGDSITVQAQWQPQNAVNVNQGVWSVSPSGIVQNVGGGKFTALQSGTCKVTLTIEKVSSEITLTVSAVPKDITLPSEVRLKQNANPIPVNMKITPSGAACKDIQCHTADGRIAQWNPATKSIVPINEGNTTLEVSVIGGGGSVLFTRQCNVVILPIETVVTPPMLLTLSVACGICALATHSTMLFPFALLAALALAVVALIRNVIPWIRHCATRQNKLETIVGLILAILYVICFSHFG